MDTPPFCTGSKKTFAASLTKSSLTPCRRPGLSRRSSNSLNKSGVLKNVVCTPNTGVQEAIVPSDPYVSSMMLNRDESQKVPLKLSDTQNKHSAIRKVRRCLTVVSKTPDNVKGEIHNVVESVPVGGDNPTCKKVKLNLKQTDIAKEVRECTTLNSDSSPNFVYETDKCEKCIETVDEIDNLDREVTLEAIEKLVKSIQEKKRKLEQLKVQDSYAKKHNLEELRAFTAKWKRAGQEALEYSVSLAKHAGYSITTKQLMRQHGFPRHLMGYNSEDDEFE